MITNDFKIVQNNLFHRPISIPYDDLRKIIDNTRYSVRLKFGLSRLDCERREIEFRQWNIFGARTRYT